MRYILTTDDGDTTRTYQSNSLSLLMEIVRGCEGITYTIIDRLENN